VIRDDVFFSSIREIGADLRARRFSAVELAEACLERLATLGPRLGAVVTVTRERALAQAHRANQELLAGHDRGPLHGIPYGAKDLLATKGIPTTWGAEPLRDQVFDYDATVVERLEEAGAVLVGKLAMVELAGGLGYENPDASFTGPGRTPWNPAHWSGGSSSGSGAAVAAGLVTFAIGSETSGSILSPATNCGVTGLRPTYGLVSRHGAMALCWTLDKLGPLARSADDCALVLAAIAGPDPRDATTGVSFRYRDRPRKRGGPGHRFRVGVVKDALARADPDVEFNFRRAVSALRDVADVEADVPFPDLPYREAVSTIVDAEGGAALRDLIESGQAKQLRDAADRVGGYAMLMTRAADYLDAMRSRVAMRAELDRLLSRYDALLAPTYTRLAPPIGRDFGAPAPGATPEPSPRPEGPRPPATIPAGNLAGLPAIAVPSGFGKDRLPTSMQLLGRAFSEETLVALADAYQEMTDWHRQRPSDLLATRE
jgi:Asp-tRNA(Asn)/Glu-tRNA(Gln) amidotransferase A subunit family amidase